MIGEVWVKTGASFRGNESILYWPHFVVPLEPVFVKFSLASAQGGFFSYEGTVSVDVS